MKPKNPAGPRPRRGDHSRHEGSREMLEGLVDQMRRKRDERAKALEEWGDRVEVAELGCADTGLLGTVAGPAQRLAGVQADLTAAVSAARRAAIRREQET